MRRFWTARRFKRGQTIAEYAVVTGVLLGIVVLAALFLYTFKEYGGRILDLVASEYP
ncbi:MAG: hypothetical protein R6X19_06960 [Kiritimatiellia bacterium]